MWITLLVMAVAVSLEPYRIAMTVLMLSRPQPARQLLAFLCGGLATGLTVGGVVLFAFRPAMLGSAHFTLPKVQLVIGSVALLAAAALALHMLVRRMRPAAAAEPRAEGALRTRVKRLLRGRSLWVAAMIGIGAALPSVDYLAVLAVIIASGGSVATQLSALVAFNAIAFAFVELPLLCYLVAPNRTRSTMTALNQWIQSRRHRDVVLLLVACGMVLVVAGLLGM